MKWFQKLPKNRFVWLLFTQWSIGLFASSLFGQDAPSSPTVTLIAPGIWRLRFGEPEHFTPVTFRSAPLVVDQFSDLPDCQSPFDKGSIRFVSSGRGCSLCLPLTKEEKIYGFGLNTSLFEMTEGSDKKHGRRILICPSDHPENNNNDSHAPSPFYVSTLGYGVYVDTARYATFYTGNVAKKTSVQADSTAPTGSKPVTSTDELYRSRDLSVKTMMVDIPSAHGVDVYLFGGPSMGMAVRRYNLFSGGGCVPPLWGLGMAYRGSAQLNGDESLQLAQSFRTLHIPCDIWGLEPGWQTKAYSCSFVWNKDKFPDPTAFIQKMKESGYHLNLWEHCFTNPASPIFKDLLAFSGDFLVWNGLVPDFASPEGRKIFADYHDRLLFAQGIDGVKLDECDNQPSSSGSDIPWSFPEASVFPSGLDGEQMHSLLGILYQQTLWKPLRDRNLRTWGLVRNSHALAAPLPYTLYSDSYTDKCYLRGLVKEGFGGQLWTPEVRDAGSVEELYRRLEMTIFSPYALVNCWYMRLPPWEQIKKDPSNRLEVMSTHQESEDVVRRLGDLRMSLIPYLYAAYNEYHLHGTPPIRALVMDWPTDPATFNVDNEFMFGPSILVAPLLKGETNRSVYLPVGTWHDFWTNETIAGGQSLTVSKPVDQIPLYIKDNVLLPLAKPVEHVSSDTCFELTVNVYGTAPEALALYEDDGFSYDYEQGKQNRLRLQWKNGQGTVEKTGAYAGAPRYRLVSWIVK